MDELFYQTGYANKFDNINLEPLGIYLTSHDAFSLPSIDKGVVATELKGGGKRLYAMPKEKSIKITLMVDNAVLVSPDLTIRRVLDIFYKDHLSPLVLSERPDRYIDCILEGAVSVGDEPGFTQMELSLLAPVPYFKSIDPAEIEIDGSGLFVAEGNAPHFPRLEITGPAVNPTITVQTELGTQQLTYTGSLGASDSLVIDTLNGSALFNTNPVSELITWSLPFTLSPGTNLIQISSGHLKLTCHWFYY